MACLSRRHNDTFEEFLIFLVSIQSEFRQIEKILANAKRVRFSPRLLNCIAESHRPTYLDSNEVYKWITCHIFISERGSLELTVFS